MSGRARQWEKSGREHVGVLIWLAFCLGNSKLLKLTAGWRDTCFPVLNVKCVTVGKDAADNSFNLTKLISFFERPVLGVRLFGADHSETTIA